MDITCEFALFDFDGVVIDSVTNAKWVIAEWGIAQGTDRTIAERFVEEQMGLSLVGLVQGVVPAMDLSPAEAVRITKELLQVMQQHHVKALPGADTLLRQIHPWRWAIGSGSDVESIRNRLQRLALPRPRVIVGFEEVGEGNEKPKPHTWKLAAQMGGVDPRRCVVFEDTTNGILGAKHPDVGALVIAVRGTHSDERLIEAGADIVVDSLAQIQVRSFGPRLTFTVNELDPNVWIRPGLEADLAQRALAMDLTA